MLKKRIIPVLLLKEGRMVKGKQFNNFRDVGNPITAAKVYNAQKVDELVFLDIEPSPSSRSKVRSIIKEVAQECFMPLTIGGGIKSADDIQELLSIGADKVAINSVAVKNPDFIKQSAGLFGNQCIVVSVDYKSDLNNKRNVYIHSGKEKTKLDPIDHIKKCVALGAGEILLTNIDHEGEMTGYDLDFLKYVVSQVNIPIIASGGAGTLDDFYKAFTVADVSAVSAGSIFHFTDQSPIKSRFYLKNHNINVRV